MKKSFPDPKKREVGDSESPRVLLCGHRAFAAQGLAQRLNEQGCQVVSFSRGEVGRQRDFLSGPVARLHEHPHLDARYDTVINYIVLRGEGVEGNLAYLHSVLRLCAARSVGHLVHISSLSVYQDTVASVTEEAATKTDPRRSGSYAALKVAAELFLREQARPPLRVSFVRPAYILAPRMNDPMGSVGFRLPGKRLLVLGPGQIQRPLITRNILNQAVATLVARPPAEAFEVLLLVDPQSPGRLEYLRHCATLLGRGWRAVSYPRLIWAPIYAAALLARDWRRPSLSRVMRSIRERQLLQTFDPQRTERRLGFSLQDDWRSALG